MEIVKRGKGKFRFKVVRPFLLAGREVKKNEEIEVNESDQTLLVENGRIVPCDIPEVGVYIALKPFYLPGAIEKYEAKTMELVSLKGADALALMLQGVCIPKDETRWRPRNRRLRSDRPTRSRT